MNFDGNFRRVGSANVDTPQALLEKLTEASWEQDVDKRPQADYSNGAQVILLVHDEALRHDQPIRQPALEVFGKAIRPVLAVTADHFDASAEGRALIAAHGAGYFVRARLLRVVPGVEFRAAADEHPSELASYRVHVPLMSAQGAEFTVGDESLSIPEGEIFEINNSRPRRLRNGSNVACVHLVLDYVLGPANTNTRDPVFS